MAEIAAASQFLYRNPQATNSERDWLYKHGKKAEILIMRQVFQHVVKNLHVGKKRKISGSHLEILEQVLGNLTAFTWLPTGIT